ncbi:prolyl oligopeptidase family serine peptidase [Nitrincola nitratireducens]|uniref:Putative dienelactone hydrolase n=1 Tax=Nitrincola nitratireducens TaxID=1229521 RepID=W9VK68_9GAMM|nr:prolyl oligopeptidase family serine peptidase [Nitrincola nitratireducens]EXJ10945.1 putative dienelactone hydrolase [Nitrincola nitratireducens]
MMAVPSAEKVVKGFKEYHSLAATPQGVAWVESNPVTGRNRLYFSQLGSVTAITPEESSVRSRVNEYGGVAWTRVDNAFAWVNAADQQIWISPYPADDPILSCPEVSVPLTSTPQRRFADLVYDGQHQRLLAVCEIAVDEASEPQQSIVSIDCTTGAVLDILQGADFYAYPRLSPDGKTLVWIEWQHPHQPWLFTQFKLIQLEDGHPVISTQTQLANNASWLQPRFLPNGDLVALGDPDNWWNPYVFKQTEQGYPQASPLLDEILPVEFTTAPWALGLSTFAWDEQGHLHALVQEQGYSRYWRFDAQTKAKHSVTLPFSRLSSLSLSSTHAYCVAESEDRYPGVVALDLVELTWKIIVGADTPDHPVSLPQPYWIKTTNACDVQSFYYPPLTPPSQLTQEPSAPPLILLTHGGPTSATYPVLNPRVQYWTSAGFAVADINYRGSCGYGREFRCTLAGCWGRAEVEDVEHLVDQLVAKGLAHTDALFIRGQSAGGYTTLMALIHSARFKAGASLYGVSDLLPLHAHTHKFESHYLSWLVGDESEMSQPERSPAHLAHALQAEGVIFFQGLQDPVVVPEQTHAMVAALKAAGKTVEAIYFADEAHGFRLALHQQQVLERELTFYMGFKP